MTIGQRVRGLLARVSGQGTVGGARPAARAAGRQAASRGATRDALGDGELDAVVGGLERAYMETALEALPPRSEP